MRSIRQSAAPDALDRLTAFFDGPEKAGEDLPAGRQQTSDRVVPVQPIAPTDEVAPVARVARPIVLDAAVVRILGGLVALSLLAAAVAGFLFFRGRPGAIGAPRPALTMSASGSAIAGSPGSPAPSGSSASSASIVVVAVEGKVRRPGVVQLPNGSRVIDAVAAAGGSLPGTDLVTVNLAAKLTDGQQIVVGGAGVGAPGVGGSPAGVSGPLNINQATAGQLDGLPGVGPVTAERIVAWRTSHGGFQRVDQLQDVPGIGPSKFTQLRALVTL